MLLPNGTRARVMRMTLLLLVAAAVTKIVLRSFGAKPTTVRTLDGRLEAAELDREATAERAAVVQTRAAEARSATQRLLARAESLRMRVRIAGAGQLRVEDTGAAQAVVPVPPLVIDLLQADSAAISALSVALTWDSSATAALEERLVAEAKLHDAERSTIAALERERRPRCGRRCGMVLGAATIVALGIAVDHTRRLLHP